MGATGEVLNHLEQSVHVDTLLPQLLNPDTSRIRHLTEIHKAPVHEWAWLVSELLKNSLSVKEAENAAKTVSQIAAIPDEFQAWLKPDKWKKEAIKDADDKTVAMMLLELQGKEVDTWSDLAKRHKITGSSWTAESL